MKEYFALRVYTVYSIFALLMLKSLTYIIMFSMVISRAEGRQIDSVQVRKFPCCGAGAFLELPILERLQSLVPIFCQLEPRAEAAFFNVHMTSAPSLRLAKMKSPVLVLLIKNTLSLCLTVFFRIKSSLKNIYICFVVFSWLKVA